MVREIIAWGKRLARLFRTRRTETYHLVRLPQEYETVRNGCGIRVGREGSASFYPPPGGRRVMGKLVVASLRTGLACEGAKVTAEAGHDLAHGIVRRLRGGAQPHCRLTEQPLIARR